MANGINGASCYLKDVPSHTIPTPRPRVWMHDTDAHPLTNMAAEMPTNVNIRSSGDTLFTFKRNFCYQNRPPVACPSGSMSPPTPTPRTAVWFDRFIKQEKYKNRLPSYIPSHNLQSSRSPRTPQRMSRALHQTRTHPPARLDGLQMQTSSATCLSQVHLHHSE